MSAFGYDIANDIVAAGSSGFYVLGQKAVSGTSPNVITDIWLFKIDNDANLLWEKTFGDSRYDRAAQIKVTGNELVFGYTSNVSGYPFYEMQIIKTDLNGNFQKKLSLKPEGYLDQLSGIEPTSDDGFIAIANHGTSAAQAVGIFKFDVSTQLQWNKTYAINDRDFNVAYTIKETSDNGYLIPLYRFDNIGVGMPTSDSWLIKTNPSGFYQ